jgi:hypothetical protein
MSYGPPYKTVVRKPTAKRLFRRQANFEVNIKMYVRCNLGGRGLDSSH